MSDGDVLAAPDYLRRVVAPLRDPAVGAVTCPYASRPADVSAVASGRPYLDAEFVPSAIFAHESLGVLVGLGATIAVRRADLDRAGGYAVHRRLSDRRLSGRGADQPGSACASSCATTSSPTFWATRVSAISGTAKSAGPWASGPARRRGYPGLLLTYTTPLALGLAAATGFSAVGTAMLTAALFLRLLLAWRMQEFVCGRKDWRSPRLAAGPGMPEPAGVDGGVDRPAGQLARAECLSFVPTAAWSRA